MSRSVIGAGLSALFLVSSSSVLLAQPRGNEAEQLAFFEKKIRPVLVNQCYSCHSDEAKSPRGGLLLDTRAGLLEGGDSGPGLIAGNPSRSLIVQAMRGSNGVSQMPPKEKLSADVIADFERWIRMGAFDPRTGDNSKANVAFDPEKTKNHWAYQPIKSPAVPKTEGNWAATDIDQFILAKLNDKGLKPVGKADDHTVVRRLYFDLIGLPPTPAQIDEFVNDRSPDKLAKLVDELLAKPEFGEKWGRHWLDVARYAESSGMEQNIAYPYAWRYRDYVIDSFNKDKPIDQFFKEQLAGDLLPAKDDDQRAEMTIGTGYLAIGPKSHNERNVRQFQLDLADEQIDTFSQGMLGVTIACARCHDHKFDPIPTKEYYAMAGIFTSSDTRFGTPQSPQSRHATALIDLPNDANVPTGPTMSSREYERLKERLEGLEEQRREALAEARENRMVNVRLLGLTQQIGTVQRQLSYYWNDGSPKKVAMGVLERQFGARDMPIHIRGEVNKTGEIVPRGFVSALTSEGKMPRIRNGSGRIELADWVASADHPLTSRVFVNRVWQHLFGRGLVSTPDNFGTTGQPPSHPELLDHLAVQFTSNGWSVKQLIKTLILTETYQMSSDYHADNAAVDPENVYLWRMSKRRLTAESIRDSMLAISGELNTRRPQGSPVQRIEGNVNRLGRFGFGPIETAQSSRSVYMPIVRDNVPEVLEVFDFAEPSLVSGKRDITSVPSQSLYLLNNPEVMRIADKTAERLRKEYLSETERIEAAFKLALGRAPTDEETEAATKFLADFAKATPAPPQRGFGGQRRPGAAPQGARPGQNRPFGGGGFQRPGMQQVNGEQAAWSAFAQSLFATAEFRYLD